MNLDEFTKVFLSIYLGFFVFDMKIFPLRGVQDSVQQKVVSKAELVGV